MPEVSPNTPDALVFVREAVADIGVYLAQWRARTEPDPVAHAAAWAAVERLNTTVYRLQELRDQLVDEITHSDDQPEG